MVTRVLRPLAWLSQMENRTKKRASGWVGNEDFRKTALFDQLLDFRVEMIGEEDVRH